MLALFQVDAESLSFIIANWPDVIVLLEYKNLYTVYRGRAVLVYCTLRSLLMLSTARQRATVQGLWRNLKNGQYYRSFQTSTNIRTWIRKIHSPPSRSIPCILFSDAIAIYRGGESGIHNADDLY
jgi:hypothetical protein